MERGEVEGGRAGRVYAGPRVLVRRGRRGMLPRRGMLVSFRKIEW